MDQSMMNGFMKRSSAIPRPYWSNTREPMGCSESYASVMHCYQALVCYSAMGHLRTNYFELIWYSRVAWESP